MDIRIRTSGLDLTTELRSYVERRLAFALARVAPRLATVDVVVEDVNGPRGGVDLRCRVLASGARLGDVRATATSDVLRGAIDQAAARVARGVHRAVSRLRRARAGSRSAPRD